MKLSFFVQILIATFLGLVVGLLTPSSGAWFGIPLIKLYGLLRDLFLDALQLILIPLVASFIIVRVSNTKQSQSVGQLGIKACAALFAVLVGWAFIAFVRRSSSDLADTLVIPEALENLPNGFAALRELFLLLIPSNIVEAARKANMLGIIVFALLFGFSMTKIDEHAASILRSFFSGIFQITMRITHLIVRALPIGVFGLIAHITATSGWAGKLGSS